MGTRELYLNRHNSDQDYDVHFIFEPGPLYLSESNFGVGIVIFACDMLATEAAKRSAGIAASASLVG